MRTLIRICVVLFCSLHVVCIGTSLSIYGEPCQQREKHWDEIAQEHFQQYVKRHVYEDRDIQTLQQTSMATVLSWNLEQQAKYGDYVTRKMARECESVFTAFAEDGLKMLRKAVKKGDSFHNQGAVCNAAFIIQTLPDGALKNKFLTVHKKLTAISLASSEQVKFEL